MPITGNAFSDYRDVIVRFNASEGLDIVGQTAQLACPPDAYKAALAKVAQIEAQYAADSTSVVDKTAQAVVCTGANRYQLHSFLLTLDISAADYTFIWVETVPNAESLA